MDPQQPPLPPSAPPSVRRRRQPALVRRNLLEAAAALALEGGPEAVTVQAVARRGGVTKGALFHHFSDKDALLSALFDDILEAFSTAISTALEDEPADAHGRFTRAYIRATLDPGLAASAPLNAVLLLSPPARARWSDWLRILLHQHRETDQDLQLEILRHSADGLWLAELWQVAPDLRHPPEGMLAALLSLTRLSARSSDKVS